MHSVVERAIEVWAPSDLNQRINTAELGFSRIIRKHMGFTLDTAISELRRAVPAFSIDAEWERENLSYLAFGDFARFICSEAEVLQYANSEDEARSLSKVQICMAFLERALEQSDAAGRDMVLDCVEALFACQWEKQIKKWAGPQVSAAWGLTR